MPDLKSLLGFCIFVEMKVIMPITSLDQLDLNATYTYTDYLQWQLKERLELLRGKIALISPAPSVRHQRISGKLHGILWTYLNGNPCEVFSAPFDVRLTRQKNAEEVTTIVQPDLCVICDASKLDEQGCNGAPELIIEILSPGNTHKEMKDKFDLYQEAGVEAYWIVHPQDNNVLIYELNEEGKFIGKPPLTEGDILTSNLFTDLTIDLKNIFAEK